MKTMNNSVTLKFIGVCSIMVLSKGKRGQEEKCLGSTGNAENKTNKIGGKVEKVEEIGR
jgi:hypothetical protein